MWIGIHVGSAFSERRPVSGFCLMLVSSYLMKRPLARARPRPAVCLVSQLLPRFPCLLFVGLLSPTDDHCLIVSAP